MDPLLALEALAVLLIGSLLGALALWCRVGRGPRARFWVRKESFEESGPFPYGEIAVLVVLPLLAQVLIVSGLLMGLSAVDAVRDAGIGWLYATMVIGEVVLCAALLASVGYRVVLPLWIYPSWVRPERRQDREKIRAR